MKVVLLAGGFGTRISEESMMKPKPMIEIDGQPILWHIMKEYSYYGFNEFIICAGYKQHVIKEYFANYYLYHSDITFDFVNGNTMRIHSNVAEPWKVTIVDTGYETLTGGRIRRVRNYIGNETFMMTYGDGVCDVNIREVAGFHMKHGKIATVTAVQPGGRFGTLEIQKDGTIRQFSEKKKEDGGWINGGYMVLQPQIFDYIDGDMTAFEKEPLEWLSKEGQLAAYKYDGFWRCMYTMKEKLYLEDLSVKGKAPWKVWEGSEKHDGS